jgi:predicted MFS family arabinose efflux permease
LSVTGRLVSTGLASRHGMIAVTAAVFAAQAAGVAALPFLARSALGAVACVIAVGVGFGVATIVRPAPSWPTATAPTDTPPSPPP